MPQRRLPHGEQEALVGYIHERAHRIPTEGEHLVRDFLHQKAQRGIPPDSPLAAYLRTNPPSGRSASDWMNRTLSPEESPK